MSTTSAFYSNRRGGAKLGIGHSAVLGISPVQTLDSVSLDFNVEENGPAVKYSKDGAIQGIYVNGKVYLVLVAIEKGKTMAIVLHELGEHARHLGFAKDEEYQAILAGLEHRKDSSGKTGNAIRAAMKRATDAGAKPEHFWSEVAAYIVEENANIEVGLIGRVVNFFKKWLFKVAGISADVFTPADLVLFAKSAVAAETGGRMVQSAMLSMREKFGQVDVESENYKRWFGNWVVGTDTYDKAARYIDRSLSDERLSKLSIGKVSARVAADVKEKAGVPQTNNRQGRAKITRPTLTCPGGFAFMEIENGQERTTPSPIVAGSSGYHRRPV